MTYDWFFSGRERALEEVRREGPASKKLQEVDRGELKLIVKGRERRS